MASAIASQNCNESKNWCVYVHTNKANGKKYVGRTAQDPEQRWRNGDGYKQQRSPFYDAVQQYGWDGFNHEIVASGLTYEQAHDMEIKFIAEYHSSINENGYNVFSGRDIFTAQTIPICQFDRTGLFIREYPSCYAAASGVKYDAMNIRMCCDGTNKTSMGYIWRFKEDCPPDMHIVVPHRYPYTEVLQFDMAGAFLSEYSTIKEAAKASGCIERNIRRVCSGQMCSTHNFMWRYKSDFSEIPDKIEPYSDPRKARVAQFTLAGVFINEYESINEAARQNSLNSGRVCEACNGTTKTAGGFIWRYAASA